MKFFSNITKIKKKKLLFILLASLMCLILLLIIKISVFGFSNPSINLIYSSYKTMDSNHTSTRITGTIKKTPEAFQLIEDIDFNFNLYHMNSNIQGDFNLSFEGNKFAETIFSMSDDSLAVNLSNSSDITYVLDLQSETNFLNTLPLDEINWMKYISKSMSSFNKMTTKSNTGVRVNLSPEMIKPLLSNLIDIAEKDDELKEAIFEKYNVNKNNTPAAYEPYLEMKMDTGYPLYLDELERNIFVSIDEGLFENNEIFFNISNNRIESIQFELNKNNILIQVTIEFLNTEYILPKTTKLIKLKELSDEEKDRLVELEVTALIQEIYSLEPLANKIEASSTYNLYSRYKSVDNSKEFLLDIFNMIYKGEIK